MTNSEGEMTMVRHVADKVCEALGDWMPVPMHRMAYEDVARAAIQAMRAMQPVVRENGKVVHELRGDPEAIWHLLIDTALSTPEGEAK